MTNVESLIKNLSCDSKENDYIVDCLKAAVSYCKQQFEDSGVDWLPTVNFVGLSSEADKFKLLELYVESLRVV